MNRPRFFANSPSYLELWLIVLTGFLHGVVELMWDGRHGKTLWLLTPDQLYNLLASVLWSGYVLWRLATTPGIARAWGFRGDNFMNALGPSVLFVTCAAVLLLVYGKLTGRLVVPQTFWLALLLYPLYGIAQQFALQVLVAKNLRSLISTTWVRASVTGAIFSIAHFPNAPLMVLVAPVGLVFTLIYESRPNLWAVGLAHGLLGAMVYYMVLGLDPGAQILEILGTLSHWH